MHQVVFTGRLLKGADRARVETELQRLFRATPRQVEWFLRGKAIVVKSTEDLAQATRYLEALVKAGLECELRSDRPATEPMAPPPDEFPAPQEQLPIPEVPPAPTRPEPAAQRPPQRPPTLGPVTRVITAGDKAPVFTPTPAPERPPHAPASGPTPAARNRRNAFWLLFLLGGAVLLGVLAYGVREQWPARPPAAVRDASAPAGMPVPAAEKSTAAGAADTETDTAAAPTPETLIVGRWQCVEAASGRVVENEFTEDGRYRSLAHGRADAFQQIDQLDVLVEGRYRMVGDRVVVHVQSIPSREFFGGSAHADEYLYWRIDTLTPDAMVWADQQLQEVRESCLRSQTLSPGTG